MRHRGPDEPGTWSRRRCGAGLQPAVDHRYRAQPPAAALGPADVADRYVLVFNGEIYNYLELRDGAGDRATALVSHRRATARRSSPPTTTGAPTRWPGCAACSRFALWDTVERELFCARDPFGIKPLFMATGSGGHGGAAARRSACWTCADAVGHRRRHRRPRRAALHRCCSTCRSRRRCTAASGGWSRAATPRCGPASRRG